MINLLYLDGWRLCVVYARGWKWARAIDCGTLRNHRLPVRDLRHARPVVDVPPKRLARRLERTRRRFKRLGVPAADAVAVRVIRQLRDAA